MNPDDPKSEIDAPREEEANPYASPRTEDRSSMTLLTGPAWGLLYGPIQGATFGVLAGLSLAAVATIFFAITRLPGWFGPSEGMGLRLVLYFALAGMVGGVAGMAVGAIGGIVLGFLGRWLTSSMGQAGAFVFAFLGACLTVSTWGREMLQTDSQWRILGPIAAVVVSAAYAGAAGRRTGLSIQRTLRKLAAEENKRSESTEADR